MTNPPPVPHMSAAEFEGNSRPRLTWALCIATLNRIESLEICVRCALAQTCLPSEIVIVDAGDDWAEHRARIENMTGVQDVPLRYLKAEKRSLTHQRNQGTRAAEADILFMIDDDAYMHPDCAEKVMAVYEADLHEQIAAISCSANDRMPNVTASDVDRKDNSASRAPWVREMFRTSRFVRFVWREIFLMSVDRTFIAYDAPRNALRADLVRRLGIGNCVAVKHIKGFALTVRRGIVLKEPFEEALLSYSPGEDTDATYRFTRHGANARVTDARLYHHHAAAGRIKRRQAIELTMTNLAFFLRKRSSNLRRDIFRYYVLALRRLLAELLKDGLSRRWSFPQLRGTFAGIRRSFAVFRADRDTLGDWYQGVQKEILSR